MANIIVIIGADSESMVIGNLPELPQWETSKQSDQEWNRQTEFIGTIPALTREQVDRLNKLI